MITVGIDVGSVTTKVVLLEDTRIIGQYLVPTKADPNLAAQTAFHEAIKSANISPEQVEFTVTTGYGRRAIDYGDKAVTEISANAKGAVYLGSPAGQVRTIIDLGGQDSKVISLDSSGNITRFVMNDKCAAGTGRFLEVMANTLDVSLGKLGAFSLKSTDPVKINSTCTVFAESEVISLIARRKRKQDIIAGLHNSIAKRIGTMAKNVGVKDVIFFDGGGAKNIGIKAALEKRLGFKLYVTEEPQFVVALGAALFAWEYAQSAKTQGARVQGAPVPRPDPSQTQNVQN